MSYTVIPNTEYVMNEAGNVAFYKHPEYLRRQRTFRTVQEANGWIRELKRNGVHGVKANDDTGIGKRF